jgi:hypothetical protein
MYAPPTGRWLSEDPAGYVDGPNQYLYVRNNPINMTDPSGNEILPPGFDWDYKPFPKPPKNPFPGLPGMCDGLAACQGCDRTACLAVLAEIEKAAAGANAAALGTLAGWLEEHGLGSYGGRCHYWSGVLTEQTACCPARPKSCLKLKSSQKITLDGNKKWADHSVNVVKNDCTGKCKIIDDGFWGNLGQVYDPCTVAKPPLVGPIGQKQWNDIRGDCGCGGAGAGPGE